MPVPIPLTLNSPCAVVHLLITRVTDVLRKRDKYERHPLQEIHEWLVQVSHLRLQLGMEQQTYRE